MPEAFVVDGVRTAIGRYAGGLAHPGLAIAEHLERELGPRFAPPALLRDKVAAEQLGRKSGEGFYSW